MRIHTDKITRTDLEELLPLGLWLDVSSRGSHKRAGAFEIKIHADPGADAHGIKRCYRVNSGQHGAEDFGWPAERMAATWIEWGDYIASLFKIDPLAIIGPYNGAFDFVYRTMGMAPHRPARENAPAHVDRWWLELEGVRQDD